MPESIRGQKLLANVGSCSHFHAGQINLFGRAKLLRTTPSFQIQLHCFSKILLCSGERFALSRYWQIKTTGHEPLAIVLEYCVDGFHV